MVGRNAIKLLYRPHVVANDSVAEKAHLKCGFVVRMLHVQGRARNLLVRALNSRSCIVPLCREGRHAQAADVGLDAIVRHDGVIL